jgi:hypothetical protein
MNWTQRVEQRSTMLLLLLAMTMCGRPGSYGALGGQRGAMEALQE